MVCVRTQITQKAVTTNLFSLSFNQCTVTSGTSTMFYLSRRNGFTEAFKQDPLILYDIQSLSQSLCSQRERKSCGHRPDPPQTNISGAKIVVKRVNMIEVSTSLF